MVGPPDDRSEQDKEPLARLWQMAPELPRFRPCHPPFYRLFAQGIPTQCARSRRPRLVTPASYQAHAWLAKALKQIGTNQLDTLSVVLGWAPGQRPNPHGERNTRVLRMRQKPRDKRRTIPPLATALELALSARRLEHPLYPDKIRAFPVRSQETTILKRAA